MSNEGQIIRRIDRALAGGAWVHRGRSAEQQARVALGIGDDAAVVAPGRRQNLILTCDAFLEGVHFLANVHPPDSVGYKALVRATSDIAAMGAVPRFFLLTITLPATRTGPWLDSMLRGMARAARSMKMTLIGGDTTKNDRVAISITAVGEAEPGRALTRAGARAGDLIYGSGPLGGAELGLMLIRRGLGRQNWAKRLVRHHLYPVARLELGRWLARRQIPSAMMDLSDGLSTDLTRLCTASKVGALLWSDRIPQPHIPAKLAPWLKRLHLDPARLALHGGDDYELLFTVPKSHVLALRRAAGAARLTPIGEITRRRDILLLDSSGRAKPLESGGWDPFRRRQVGKKVSTTGAG